MIRDAVDLINRQKAEIERLNKEVDRLSQCVLYHEGDIVDAIKEFAERLNKEAEKVEIDREGDFVETDNKIYDTVANWCKETSDNLVKEMTGENNGN